ncbi:hypothetical protein ColTof3_07481 [Colletotrichum tofieldiae]|nr:hypothetical protein ColTof3_07481 [Colletotrichum tofieldiae]
MAQLGQNCNPTSSQLLVSYTDALIHTAKPAASYLPLFFKMCAMRRESTSTSHTLTQQTQQDSGNGRLQVLAAMNRPE